MRREIFVAYDLAAFTGRIESVSEKRVGGKGVWKVALLPEELPASMEMAFGEYPPAQIGEMRARRILLDEKLPQAGDSDLNHATLDLLVRGQGGPLEVIQSPFPQLYRDHKRDESFFLVASRLVAVLWLRMSGVAEHIFELSVWMEGDTALGVRFEGQRRRQYASVEPMTIHVEGTCQLA
jgi:hypothetical protein